METTLGTPTTSAIAFFLVIVGITLAITYWAAKRTRSTKEFYAAGRSVSALQNGLALAGDYMSAASFLGIAGLVALKGYDGMIYATGWLVGWPALMFLIAEPLRNLGKYTFADVVAFRLRQTPVRIASAIGGVLTVLFYTIAQMVGAGNLIKLMFGISYEWAVVIVGVDHAGLRAVRRHDRDDLGADHQGGPAARRRDDPDADGAGEVRLQPGEPLRGGGGAVRPGGARARRASSSNRLDAVSLGIALMLGLLGLPHILMRFYTVPDAKAARTSVLYATGFIGYFYIIIPIVGFGAAALVGRDLITKIDKGGNMAAPLLAEQLAGTPFLGFIAAVAFATILAVVAGLTLAGASALSHDIYVHVVKKGKATEQEQVQGGALGDGRLRHRRRAAGHRLQGPERRVHGRPGVRHRVQRELPGAAAVDRLAQVHHGRRGGVDPDRVDPRRAAHHPQPDGLGRRAEARRRASSRCATRRSSR